ncbi:hypothetical protein Hanom_Chr16g01437641 [Helianthus anomalus]
MQAFSCLATLPASALVIACPATNPWSLSPTRGDTPVKSTHACFPPSHPCSGKQYDPNYVREKRYDLQEKVL